MDTICKTPFYTAEIFSNGDVFCCCPAYIKSGPIGNIFTTSWNNIWNSEKAQEFRKKILNNDYSFCKKNFCDPTFFPLGHELEASCSACERFDTKITTPKIIKISTDISCNVMCTLCRTELHCNDDIKHTEFLNSKIDSIFIPLFKDVEVVNFTGSGDPFASKHFRKLIKKISEVYPKIKFNLHTNGILCNEENLKELGILDRISVVQISIHSATKEIYDKIVKNGNWDKLNCNLEYLSNLIKQKKLDELHLNFVTTSVNYKDIPSFVDLCMHYNAKGFLWNYRDLMFNALDYDNTNICSPIHKNHKDFVSIISDDKVKSADNIFLSPLLKKISKVKNIEEYALYSSIIMDVITERYDETTKYSVSKWENDKATSEYYKINEKIPTQKSKTKNEYRKNSLLENVFSVRKLNNKKIITILGIKIKV